jgi:hypothetical protein
MSNKIPAETADALARRLQTSLKRRRPRTWLAYVVVFLAIGGLALVAWWLYNPTPPVRLEVIALDSVVGPDETPEVFAQLAFPDTGDYSPSLLAGRDVVFIEASATSIPGRQGMQKSAVSDAKGRAKVEWPRPGDGKSDAIVARYADVRFKQGSQDKATLFTWDAGRPILLVDVDDTLVPADGFGWETTPLGKTVPRAGAVAALQAAAKKDYLIGYIALAPERALSYRLARGWVGAHFPAGPVIGRPVYPPTADRHDDLRTLLKSLKPRFGERITLIAGQRAAIDVVQEIGIRGLVLGEPVPGAAHMTSWADLARHLEP